MPVTIERWTRRALAVLVRFYPKPFRRKCGADLQDAYVDRLAALWGERRLLAFVALGGRAIWHTARDATLERLAGRRRAQPGEPGPRSPLGTLGQDIRFALRRLRREPLFTTVAIATLVLGIGANTAIFSVVNAVLLRPLAFPNAAQLVKLCETNPETDGFCSASPPNAQDWARASDTMQAIGVATAWPFVLKDEQGTEGLYGGIATAGMFDVMGLPAAHGRLIAESDMAPGAEDVLLLSHAFWTDRFGANEALIGSTLTLDEQPYRVIGVLPAAAEVPGLEPVQLWAPLEVQAEDRYWRGLSAFGRLREGVDLETARAELEGIQSGLASAFPDTNGGWGITVRPLLEEVVGPVRPTLMMFLGAVGLVLLIACANVANLVVTQTTGRLGELSVRAALGARQARLVQLMVVEGALLSVTGGALGLVLSAWATRAFVALAPRGIPRIDEVGLDGGVVAFAAAVTLFTTIIFGLAPALRFTRADATGPMAAANPQRAGVGGGRTRGALVVVQVALAFVLLISAGLLTRNFAGFLDWQPEIDRSNLLTVWILSSTGKYSDQADIALAHQKAVDEVAALPSVTQVSFASSGPLFGRKEPFRFAIEGSPTVPAGQEPVFNWHDIGPDYFDILGLEVRRGRGLLPSDQLADTPVAVINETAAAAYFGAESPLGRRLHWVPDRPVFEVVGVVEDMPPYVPGDAVEPAIYVPYAQMPRSATYLLVKTRGGADLAAREVHERLQANDPDMQITPMSTFTELEGRQLARPRFNMLLLAIFAAVALTLASVGIYAVMAYGVTMRTHEIGVRMAMGATPAQVRGEVLRSGARLALLGLAAGAAAALAGGRLIAGLLHGVEATDPATFLIAAGTFALVGIGACYLPARRASKLDPVNALRGD